MAISSKIVKRQLTAGFRMINVQSYAQAAIWHLLETLSLQEGETVRVSSVGLQPATPTSTRLR